MLEYLSPRANLISLDVHRVRIDEESLAHLARIPSLRVVSVLEVMGVSDKGLQHLTRLVNLESLHLRGAIITPAGLRDLAAMPKLTSLYLEDCRLDDAAVEVLAGCAGLSTLGLRGNPITDKAMEPIARIKGLDHLDLSRTAVTAKGLRALRGLRLTWLDLSDTNVDDEGMWVLAQLHAMHSEEYADLSDERLRRHIQEAVGISDLDLRGTKITDEGLRALEGMNLKRVWLDETQITEPGVARLRAARPMLHVEWDKLDESQENAGRVARPERQ